jgi:predicted PurR-regulated permease PerM
MSIQWSRFYPFGKKVLIWLIFLLILYVLSDLFDLVFFTYILAFITFRLSSLAVKHLKVSRAFAISILYLLLLVGIIGAGYLVIPRVFHEARQFAKDLPHMENNVMETIEDLRGRYSELAPLLNEKVLREQIETKMGNLRDGAIEALPHFIKGTLQILTKIILAIIFSFLIVIDLARLSQEMKRLRATRLHDFFQETAMPVVRFAQVVGRAFEAQTLIACLNTTFTVLGMMMLGIPKVALLGIVVFVFSFVPVLGVFISSAPILLVAFNAGGPWLAFAGVVMIILVHTIEAYVLNPRIYAHHMKMNPILTLIVLFLGHHLFGIWGVLLAVPVTFYFLTHIAGLRAQLLKEAEAQSSEETMDSPPTGDVRPE